MLLLTIPYKSSLITAPMSKHQYKVNVFWLIWVCFMPSVVMGQTQIIIDEVPVNTPHDATLFLASSFNNWNPGDRAYQFKAFPDGSYRITLDNPPEEFHYKITRGNWRSVEGRKNGFARDNRHIKVEKPSSSVHYIQVQSWEDISGKGISSYHFILLLSAFQGILLILALNGIQDNNIQANRILSVLILLLSFALFSRVLPFYREFFNWQPKVFLFSEMIFFAYSPVFYLYILSLLKLEDPLPLKPWMHFIPVMLHILAYFPLFFKEHQAFIDQVVDEEVHFTLAIVGGLALVYNAFYLKKLWDIVNNYQESISKTQSFDQNLLYLNRVMILNATCLMTWGAIYLITGSGFFLGFETDRIREVLTDTAWLVFSFTTYFLGYFAINQPEIFKVHHEIVKYKDTSLSNAELGKYKTRLSRIMQESKEFMNPELTLSQLSAKVGTNTHTLSRVINEGYNKSFYDFVNTYRVEEFIELVQQEENQRETFLALALRVGFNSKTTFNRAFKKVTGTTPRAYLKENS